MSPARRDPRGLYRLPLDFSHGLMQNVEDSAVPMGYAPRLESWVPVGGGLRVRPGWSNGGTGGPATPQIIGVGWQADWGNLVAVHQGASQITVYGGAGDPSAALSSLGNIAATGQVIVSMAMGSHTLAFGGPGLVKLYGVQNTGVLADSGANAVPQNSRALAYHHNAFYAGGGKDPSGTDLPSRLFFTDPGDGALGAWPTDNWIDVGLSAGGRIMSLCVHQDELLIGKLNSMWLLRGTPDDSLDLHQLDTGNAVLGDSIVSTPYGAVICGADAVYLFDGASVRAISRPIQGDYGNSFAGADAVYFDNKVYITAQSQTLVWVFDFETAAWFTETPQEVPARLMGYSNAGTSYLVGGSQGTITARALIYRTVTVPPAFGGDMSGWSESFALRTPEYWVESTEAPVHFRYLDLKLRQRGGDPVSTGLTVTPSVRLPDGSLKSLPAHTVRPRKAAGVFSEAVPLPRVTGRAVQFDISQTLPSGEASLFDIEEAVLVYQPAGFREK